MKTLVVDAKWSVEYDPSNNDRPVWWIRYGKRHSTFSENNPTLAMFYALLEIEQECGK